MNIEITYLIIGLPIAYIIFSLCLILIEKIPNLYKIIKNIVYLYDQEKYREYPKRITQKNWKNK